MIELNHIVLQAPAEAEAELARLNRFSIVNAVLSDDADTLLFGAFTVIRKYVHYVLLLTYAAEPLSAQS
jgi:5'-3' exonuclease